VPESRSVEIFVLSDKLVFFSDDELDSSEVWPLPAAATAASPSFIMLVVNKTVLELMCFEKLCMKTVVIFSC